MSIEEFQDGRPDRQLGHQNGMILAILNLYVPPMPPIVSAQSDLWFGRRCRLNYLKMADMAATLDIGMEQFYQF